MNQLAIDFQALARRNDPQTSQEAAGRVCGQALAIAVYVVLKGSGPATAHELAERMGLSLVTVSPRLKPLELAGKVERVGRSQGRTVWRAK